MKNKLETLPFKGTPEQKEQLCAIIEEYKDVPGALVQVLKKMFIPPFSYYTIQTCK